LSAFIYVSALSLISSNAGDTYVPNPLLSLLIEILSTFAFKSTFDVSLVPTNLAPYGISAYT